MGDSQLQMTATQEEQADMVHRLLHKWQLWAHLPHDTDWSLKSYKSISSIESVELNISLSKSKLSIGVCRQYSIFISPYKPFTISVL